MPTVLRRKRVKVRSHVGQRRIQCKKGLVLHEILNEYEE